jgi:ankyrin repeat protein
MTKLSKDIFSASKEGDLEFVRNAVRSGQLDLSQKNEFGFTALHCAAMGSNETDPKINLEIIKLLVEAGSQLEALGGGGRTVVYLLAEFSPTLDQIKFLIEKGANPDVCNEDGIHITENAMMEETRVFLTEITNRNTRPQIPTGPQPVKLKNSEWKKAQAQLSKAFQRFNKMGLIAMENAGYTQSDGFDECVEKYHNHNDREAIIGFCFYTKQDRDRAKEYGILPLAIWGAPGGGESDTIKVGKIVVELLRNSGFEVGWNEIGSTRPEVYLHHFVE